MASVAYHIYLVLEDEAIDVSHSHVGEGFSRSKINAMTE